MDETFGLLIMGWLFVIYFMDTNHRINLKLPSENRFKKVKLPYKEDLEK